MSVAITVNNPVYDRIVTLRAWDDNNYTLKLTQGEGITIPSGTSTLTISHAKSPRFKLTDERGVVSLSTGNPIVEWAILRPDGSEDLLSCNIITAADGLIEIPIVSSATAYVGRVCGEIRVTTSNSVVKFFGVDAIVSEGVSDDAAAQSSRFSALIAALQEVVALLDAEYVARMDTLVDGELPTNGTNPIASGQLKTFLESHYLQTMAFPDNESDITALEEGQPFCYITGSGDYIGVKIEAAGTVGDVRCYSNDIVDSLLSAKENTSNKVSSITSGNKSSTTNYPSNKAMTDYVDTILGDIEALLAEV